MTDYNNLEITLRNGIKVHYHIVVSGINTPKINCCAYVLNYGAYLKMKLLGTPLPSRIRSTYKHADAVLYTQFGYKTVTGAVTSLLGYIVTDVQQRTKEPPCIHNHTISYSLPDYAIHSQKDVKELINRHFKLNLLNH